MAVELTAAQLTRLRQRPHRTRVWLSVYQPGTVLAAQVNHPGIAKGARDITISILSGDFNSVRRGMTCYLGTTPGSQDLGRIRAIQSTSSVLTLAENATDWVNGWYLTVVAYYEPWAVFPRIILDPNNVPLFYKDYDIAYTDQNQYLDPLVNMGPNQAGFLATGAYGVYYSASGTVGPDTSIPTGFAWNFEGGMPSASALRDPGWIQYTGAGHFLTTLTVTSDNGKSLTGHRHISVYTRPDEGPRPPILRWTLPSFEGSRDSGGYAIRLGVRETADFSRVVDGALVVLFTDDWEGGVYGKKSAGSENRDTILFVGYVEDDSISINPADNSLEFNARSITGIAERLGNYSATLESKVNAMTWNELANLTVDKAVIHFLRWHSTLLEVADFSPTGDVKPVHYADFNRGDLFGAVNGLYQSALVASLVSDRQGKMWAEVEATAVPTGSARQTALGTGLDITRQDWRSQLVFGRLAAFPATAYLELGGLGYDGPYTGTDSAYLAGAPGDVAGYAGTMERASGLVVAGQDQLNVLVGNAYARANAQFPDLGIPIAGDYRILDIAPQQRILVDLAASENYRGLVWNDKPFLPHEITYEYAAENQALLMDVRAHEETSGPPGTTIVIPVDPPYDDFDLPDWDIEFPPLVPFPPLLPPITPPPGTGNTVYALIDGNLGRTRNFFDASPHWENVPLTGVTGSLNATSAFFTLDRADPINRALLGTVVGGGAGVQGPRMYQTGNLNVTGTPGPVWTEVWGTTENAQVGDPTSFQKAFLCTPEQRDDGSWHAIYGRRLLSGLAVYVHGIPGAWTTTVMGSTLGNYTNDWNNVFQRGTIIYAAALGRVYRHLYGGDTTADWTIRRTPSGMVRGLASPGIDGNAIVWSEQRDPPNPRIFKYSTQGAGEATPPTLATFYSASQYQYGSGEDVAGREAIRPIPGIAGAFYVMVTRFSGSGPLALFGVLSLAGGFVARASFADDTIGPVEVMPLDANKLASFGRAAVNGRIIGSTDGGYTWYDKTGDWATQIAVIGDGSRYSAIRFAYTI